MLRTLLGPKAALAYLLLRVVAGLMFAFHGVQKLFGILSDFQPVVGTQLWCGGVIELVTGAAIAVGFLTSWGSLVASGEMAVAYLQFHWRLELGPRLLPAVNQGELALLYAFVFLFVACRSAGAQALDPGFPLFVRSPKDG